MKTEIENEFMLGILGGMGPMAGIEFQKRIIEKAKVKKDSDHIKMICYTNPQISDRTKSLQDGTNFSSDIIQSLNMLQQMGASMGVIACNTAHAKFEEIKQGVNLPMINIVSETVKSITLNNPAVKKIGILATDGTRLAKVYKNELDKYSLECIYLNQVDQKELMNLIYGSCGIKAGGLTGDKCKNRLEILIQNLKEIKAEVVVLGCTELSLLGIVGDDIVDPVEVIANNICSMFSN